MDLKSVFRPGDNVICIDSPFAGSELQVGHEYTVLAVMNFIYIRLEGISSSWLSARFRLVQTDQPEDII